ncbi:MAG: hypothetical protein JJU26_01670 [Oceanicaulis sp.]|uniref:hypothetical protein n=1 Tax=Glycocaulis sp. TaxID=1969725 RepID=UPI0025BED711|nr:hypothetical protein [Glycocaulis sp.]MCC5980405.1 hypothetical protein [Oceanicaulis sp.]MCH8520928.1 hypothetical protein [Glycocaulis sp.]
MLTMLAASLALAGADDHTSVDALIEHALRVEGGGVTYTVILDADGTYSSDVGISGTWEVQGDELCTSRATGETNCQPIQEGLALGDSWEGENAAGETVTFTIVPRE